MTARADIFIPARAGSSRFPNKPLAQVHGHSILQRVWRVARSVPSADRVVVVSDDAAILAHAQGFGAQVLAVDGPCRNGSERVARAAELRPGPADIVVNLQGDAPLVPPWAVEAAVQALADDPSLTLTTPAVALAGERYAHFVARKKGGRSSGTTVVFNHRNDALYFSKAVLPQLRTAVEGVAPAHQHVGLYAFRRASLSSYLRLPPGRLEQQEQLEQLRWLEHGRSLRVVPVDLRGRTLWSVDHPEDLEVVAAIVAREGELGCA